MFKKIKIRIMPTILVIIFSLSICIIPAEAKTQSVIIGGESFGLKLYCKGVMVTKFESFISKGEKVCPAKDAGIRINDIILSVNNINVKSNEQLERRIEAFNEVPLIIKLSRNGDLIKLNITPKRNSKGKYRLGIWVRDSCAGIGTISYYNPEKGIYGALGHGICDSDTGGIMPSKKGEILKANITSVKKSENNNIGTLNGYFTDNTIGNIITNTPIGIYGELKTQADKKKLYKTAQKEEIKPGSATLITTVKGTKPESYSVRIKEICNLNRNSNRNFVIEVTDKRLIKATGGIVQGMSGSPIIQDGKFIGALTHVFVDNCKNGYAIFAENMM